MVFPHWEILTIVVLVSTDFPSNLKRDAPFCPIAMSLFLLNEMIFMIF